MLKRTTALSAALFWAAAGTALPAFAEAGAPAADRVVEQAPTAAVAIEHIDITVEGKPLQVRARGLGTDAVELEASAIFEALGSKFEARESILGYWRFQDGAVVGLDFRDGKVRANGAVLGALPQFPVRETADTWLSPNAISVITGTRVSHDAASGWAFELDQRLKPQFDLDLWVDGRPVSVAAGLEPRTIGPVLLVPLRPIAEAFGHMLVEGASSGTLTITRIQDSAVISLELSTGLVTVNGVPSGVTPNIAYADARNLVLPFTAVETLTGAHIKLLPGTNRVDVALDTRLSSLALPGERVADDAGATPFTPEKLVYQLSDRGPLTAEFHSRFQSYNTVSTVETVGGFDQSNMLQPRWASVDIQAMSGWRATVGDYNGAFRELSGTDASRIRGVSYRTRAGSGTLLAIAAGVPLTGAKASADGASTPTFGGFAGGVRVLKADGRVEYGVAAATDETGDASRIVAGGRKDFSIASDGTSGLESAYIAADAGLFNTAAGTTADLRGRAEARYRLTKQTALQGTLVYDGEQFESGADTSVVASGARSSAALALSWHAAKPAGIFHHLAGGLRTSLAHVGGAAGGSILSTNAAINTRLGQTGPDVSLDAGHTSSDAAGKSSQTTAFAARAFQAFDWGAVTATYTHTTDQAGKAVQRFVSTGAFPSFRKRFENNASVTLGPTASLVWSPDGTEVRAGASATADSGAAFGDRLKVNSQVVALTSVDPDKQAARLFANAGATYAVSRNALVQAVYSTDFSGRSDVSIALRGTIVFNDPRRHSETDAGAGILKGRVFFDKNRDGIRQADEPGIPGVRVSVMGTRLSLQADNQGHYTVQNIKTGLYELNIDRRSLPLGLMVANEDGPRATVGEGRITSLDIPVIASGQLRGAVFLDADGDGLLGKGEPRLEGEWLQLRGKDGGEPLSVQSAAFGQFGFERLAPGDYTLRVLAGGTRVDVPVTLTDDNLFLEVDVPVPAGGTGLLMAEGGVTGAP